MNDLVDGIDPATRETFAKFELHKAVDNLDTHDSSVVHAVLAVQDSTVEFTGAMLSDANRAFLLAFLKAARFRESLAAERVS